MNTIFLILNFKYINKYNTNSLLSVLDILHIFVYYLHYIYLQISHRTAIIVFISNQSNKKEVNDSLIINRLLIN